MGKSTLYDYFTSKEEILLYFVEQEMKVINQAAAEIAAQALGAPEKLQRLLRAQFVYLDANREMAALLTREVSKLDDAATRQFAKRRQEYRHILRTIIEQGIAEGVFRAVDPALAALALLSMLTMPFYDWLRRREGDSVETAIDALMDLFFSGLHRLDKVLFFWPITDRWSLFGVRDLNSQAQEGAMAYLRFLDQVSAQDTALAGGKGANLEELARAGFPVPPGFVLTTAAYRAFVETNNLQEIIGDAIQATDPEDPTELERAATTIASHFIAARMPAEIADELCRAYRTLGQGPVAVRSSATAEDLPEASFAGQQETLLNVTGEEAVLEAVRRCWASLWTARAIAYRAKRAIPSGGVALAVVVQRMVAAEMAGVLFTANPANRDPDEMVVNASRGLGEAVVSGQVTPEEIVVNRRRWKVRRCSSEDWRTVHWRQISPFTLPAPVTWMTTSPGTATSSTTSTSPSRWQGKTGQHWRRCGEPGWKAPPRPTSGTPNWRRSGKRRPGASGNACRTGNVASLTRHWRRHNARRNFVRARSSTWGWRGCHCANTRWNSDGGWSRPGR